MQSPSFTVTFNRTVDGATSTVTAFSEAATTKGAVLDARVQTRRADRLTGEAATYGDFIATRVQS